MAVAMLAWMPLQLHAALNAGTYAQTSVLTTGKWVKIKVRESGIHQITDAELRGMGFERPEKVAVYGYPASVFVGDRLSSELPDDLPPVPVMRYGGKMVFYAEGDVSLHVAKESVGGSKRDVVTVARNYFADYGTYFLTDAMACLAPEEIPYVPSASAPVAASYGMVHYEEELENVGQLGAHFFGPAFGQEPWSAAFSMPGYNAASPVGMYYRLASRLDEKSDVTIAGSGDFSMVVSLPESKQAELCYALTPCYVTCRPAVAGSYSVSVDFSKASAGYGALDYFTALYPCSNTLDGGVQREFVFTSVAGDAELEFVVPDGLERDGLKLWDITDCCRPRVFATAAGDGGTVRCSSPGAYDLAGASGPAYVVAFNPAAELLHVEPVGEVECRNLHGLATPDMLIVAAEDFVPEAERLARAHGQAGNLDVAVVLQDDVFNEFSSGVPHAMAIRRFARMLCDRNPGKLKSVLLFGGASYDNRGLTAGDREAFRRMYVPIYVCADMVNAGHRSRSFSTDAYVGMLEENAGAFDILTEPMSVNVSRIPAQSLADAADYVGKAVRYITEPPVSDFSNRALLLCDDGDHLGHMADADSIAGIIAGMAPFITVFKAYNTIYPFKGGSALDLNSHAVGALSKGVGYMGYSGHASLSNFGDETIWGSMLAKSTEYAVPPFTMFATCRGLFIDNEAESVGEAMLFNKNGGSIALVGALREVYKDHNQVLNAAVGEAFFGAGKGATMGDVFRLARNKVIASSKLLASTSGTRLAINTLCYNMVGDPEIRVQVPTCTVTLTGIGGVAVTDGDVMALEPGKLLAVEGVVTDASGDVAGDFNGDLIMGIYDAEKTMPVINIHKTDRPEEMDVTVRMDEDQIYEKRAKVADGRFSTSVYLPVPSRQGASNRVSLFAVSDDKATQAVGAYRNIAIGDLRSDETPVGSLAPVISEMYLNEPGFTDGALVDGNVTVFATVAPNEVGVVGNSTLIGRSLVLTLDGSHTYGEAAGRFVVDENGGGHLEFGIAGIADGRHELTLRVTNYAGQSVSRTLHFVVVNNMVDAQLSVEEYPARELATIGLTHNFVDEPSGRLVVKDAAGRVVYTKEDVAFPFVWNLTDAGGAGVPDGVYTVEAYLKGGTRYGYGRPAELVVNRD